MNKKNYYTTTFLFLLSSIYSYAQWNTTPSPLSGYRYDDVYFLNPNLGWAVNFSNGGSGAIIKTTDGGTNWQTMTSEPGAKYRDIGFVDSLYGFIGTLETGYNPQDTAIMYKTADGGTTWSRVTNLPGPRPGGICGMYVINDSTLYACGRYYGPAGFYKTIDKGTSWTYSSLAGFAGGIVDMYFFNKDTGIAVGGTIPNFLNAQGRVLRTIDGGNTWIIVHTSTHTNEICWKVSFPAPNVGYVSLESFRAGGPQYFLKTIDGGITWTDMQFISGGSFDAQGIGFINDSVGWIGGDPFNYKTTDAGINWTLDNFGTPVNRFRFFADTLGYAAGEYIYKFQSGSVSVPENNFGENMLVSPNPFISGFSITIQNQNLKQAIFAIKNILGQTVYYKEENNLNFNYTKTIDLSFLSKGIYFLEVTIDRERRVKKIVKE